MKFRFFGCLLVAAASSLAAPATTSAEFVYDVQADLTGDLSHFRSDAQTDNGVGDDFSVSSAVAIDRIDWVGIYYGGAERFEPGDFGDNFRIAIHRLIGNAPAPAPIYSSQVAPEQLTRSDSGFDSLGTDLYEYTANVTGLNLNSGQYMLSIANETPADTNHRWHWTTSTTGGDGYFRLLAGGDEWSPNSETFHSASFALRGVTAVPEPASLATLAFCVTLGCSGAGRLWRRRNGQRTAAE